MLFKEVCPVAFPNEGLEDFTDALRRSRKLLQALLTEFEHQLGAFKAGGKGALRDMGVTLDQLAKTQLKAQEQKDVVDAQLRRLKGQTEGGELRLAEARTEIERRLARLRASRGY